VTTSSSESLPFGAMERPVPRTERPAERRGEPRSSAGTVDTAQPRPRDASGGEDASARGAVDRGDRVDWRKPSKRRGSGRRGGRRRRRGGRPDGEAGPASNGPQPGAGPVTETRPERPERPEAAATETAPRPGGGPRPGPGRPEALEGGGMLMLEKGGYGTLRQADRMFLPSRHDVFIPERLIQQHRLREGSVVVGRLGRGQKHKYALLDVRTVDGLPPAEVRDLPQFKSLVTIDPDFHYAVGDATGDVSMRILDIICPVGRGQRGLIVAPPRSGKTTILRQFAQGIEKGYPEVHLMVLLVDERPEEATEWVRSTKGQVFVSTADETPKNHVQLAETVWKRCTRLVELGQDVVLLLDSITRLARAYNNLAAGGGRTMSGGLDSRAMERPRQIFGSARNTEAAGSLTILGTTLVDTGSRMDQLIFEEFKGTGNMELVLSRKLADRRIFPAIDIEKSGTRKEEKLISSRRLKYITILRRVLNRMSFIEAMELLVTKLDEVETNDDFLKRFEVDPEA
jgi:transcription termination factor Rho